jgi:hypothetical protein
MTALLESTVLSKAKVAQLDEVVALNFWGQQLVDISLVRRMPRLQVISLSLNAISSLRDLETCFELRELYLRKNQIADLREILVLKALPHLRVLWLSENPLTAFGFYRSFVIANVPQLSVLDDIEITADECGAATQWWSDQQKLIRQKDASIVSAPAPARTLPVDISPVSTTGNVEAPLVAADFVAGSGPSRSPSLACGGASSSAATSLLTSGSVTVKPDHSGRSSLSDATRDAINAFSGGQSDEIQSDGVAETIDVPQTSPPASDSSQSVFSVHHTRGVSPPPSKVFVPFNAVSPATSRSNSITDRKKPAPSVTSQTQINIMAAVLSLLPELDVSSLHKLRDRVDTILASKMQDQPRPSPASPGGLAGSPAPVSLLHLSSPSLQPRRLSAHEAPPGAVLPPPRQY